MDNTAGTNPALDELTEMLKQGKISAKNFERQRDKLSSRKSGHWYDNRFSTFLLLIFLPPVGFYAVLRNSNFRESTKGILIAFIGLLYFQIYQSAQENKTIAIAAGYENYSEYKEAQGFSR